MPARWVLSLMWGNRSESLEESSERLRNALNAIASIDGRFASWFIETVSDDQRVLWDARGPSNATPVRLGAETSSIALGENETVVTVSTVRLENGLSGARTAEGVLSFGLSLVPPSMWFPNSFELRFSCDRDDPLLQADAARALAIAAATPFEPLIGAFLPLKWGEENGTLILEGKILPGWLTLVSQRLGKAPETIAPVIFQDSRFQVLAVSSARFDPDDAAQTKSARRMIDELGQTFHLENGIG